MLIQQDFYYIRHGETEHNATGNNYDSSDISLNSNGRKQAATIKNLITSLPIQTICHSPLARAIETKDIITSNMLAQEIEINNLKECSGEVWDFMISQNNSPVVNHKPTLSFLKQVLNGINESLANNGPVLIVAHGGIHWAMCYLMRITCHAWRINNCEPVHFYYSKEKNWQATLLNK